MSRGFGSIERAIIELLDLDLRLGVATGPEIARSITGEADAPSVRRALKRLESKGIIVPLPNREGRLVLWVLTATAKDEVKRQRRRERDRAGRAKRKRQDQHRRVPAHDTARLEQLLGMLGSAHEGEILNAARLVERERQRLDKTWREILHKEQVTGFEW